MVASKRFAGVLVTACVLAVAGRGEAGTVLATDPQWASDTGRLLRFLALFKQD